MQVVCKCIRLIRAEVRVNPANSHIHFRHFPGIGIGFLSINRDRSTPAGMRLNKLCALHEHTAGATAAIINAAVVKRAQNSNQRFDYAGRRVEFAATNTFFFRKLSDAVFIGAPQKIFTLFCVAHIDIVGKNIDHIAQHPLIEVRTGVVLRKYIFQCFILRLNRSHGRINDSADLRGMGGGGNGTPSCFLRDKEYALHSISVAVILETIALIHKFLITLIKGCGNVAQENKPDDNFSVFCRRNVTPQNASCIPKLFLKADVGICSFCHLIYPPVLLCFCFVRH